MRLRICLFSLFLSSYVCGQEKTENTSGATIVDFLLMNPKAAEQVVLDCESDDCDRFFNNAGVFTNLSELHLKNYSATYDNNMWTGFTALNSLEISDSPNLNFRVLFRQLGEQKKLRQLRLSGKFNENVPSNIELLSSLNHFEITNNPGLNVQEMLDNLSALPELQTLSLSQNYMDELGQSIGKLANLRVLDISINNLTKLPREMSRLKHLKSINMLGNKIANPVQTLRQIEELNLTDLSIDQTIPREELMELYDLFPNATIYLVTEFGNKVILNNDDKVSGDLIASSGGGMGVKSNKGQSITYGKFNVGQKKKKLIRSESYLYFRDVAEEIHKPFEFDSLSFDDRFHSLDYVNTDPRNPNREYEILALSRTRKGKGGGVRFDFDKKERKGLLRKPVNGSRKILENNPELTAYNRAVWVYAGDLEKSEFIQKYLKGRSYLDCLVNYDADAQIFTLILKSTDGYDYIKAYPISKKRSVSVETARSNYDDIFQRYERALDKRRKKFQRRLEEDISRAKREHIRSQKSNWNSFRQEYMTGNELDFSLDEWLVYYDRIMKNERKALESTGISWKFLERYMELDGFQTFKTEPELTTRQTGSIVFKDESGKDIKDERVMLIDYTSKRNTVYKGGMGVNPWKFIFNPKSEYAVFVEQKNGKYSMASKSTVSRVLKSLAGTANIELSDIDRNLFNVQEVGRVLSR